MSWEESTTAAKMRDLMVRVASRTVERMRPSASYGVVQLIDRVERTCSVLFDNDTTPVTVKMGSLQPNVTGQRVRVEGVPGNRYITDVAGQCHIDASNLVSGMTDTQVFVDKAQHGLTLSETFVSENWVRWNAGHIISVGRGAHASTTGYFNFSAPPASTTITGVGGASNGTTSSDNWVPLAIYQALFYILPIGSNQTWTPANLRIVHYTADLVVPYNWVLICHRNEQGRVRWGTGREQDYWRTPSFVNSWTNYGGTYVPAGYKKENGKVYLRGLVTAGIGPLPSNIFMLPAGFVPPGQQLFTVNVNGVLGQLDVHPSGYVTLTAGQVSWVSLDGISFDVSQF